MIFPIGDVNSRRTVPFINYGLLLLNIVVFFWMYLHRTEKEVVEIVDTYALYPNRWQDFKTLITSMFMHGDYLHLLGNMLFLWIAGDNVEDRLGHVPYLIFYLAAGLAGAAAHIVMATGPLASMAAVPTVGASGAISGVMGAYLVFFPTSKIKFVLWLIIFVRAFTLPSWGAIGFWILSQILMARHQLDGLSRGEAVQVAVFAHLGGFAFGCAVAVLARMFGKAPRKKTTD